MIVGISLRFFCPADKPALKIIGQNVDDGLAHFLRRPCDVRGDDTVVKSDEDSSLKEVLPIRTSGAALR